MASILTITVCVLATSPASVYSSQEGRQRVQLASNPIRKVVTLLQSMQAKVEEEGKTEKALFDKYMCYCKSAGSDLGKEIDEAGVKVPAVASDIQESEAKMAQAKDALKQAQMERSAAKSAVASASSIREKEAVAFASDKADYEATIGAIKQAVASLEKGMVGAFLQTENAKVLQKLALGKQDMLESDRDAVLSFLSSSSGAGYVPSSGEVTGILKQMGDEFATKLAEATATESGAVKTFDGLVAAKKQEIDALTAAVEAKTILIGDLGVAIVQMKADLSDTEATLIANKKFLAEMETTCKTKEAEWEAIVATRGEELTAIGETIKLLNDDDALELFKKTLPSAGSSFMQLAASTGLVARRAMDVLATVRKATGRRSDRVRIDLIALALHGKSRDFAKVIALIDKMVKILADEQLTDDHKKEYCLGAFDAADDKKKSLEHSISGAEASIATIEEGIATVKEEIANLEAGLKALDKSVVEATEQRQAEHTDFTELMASDAAAKELLGFAKNRMNKFYNPKLYKAPAKRVLSAEDDIVVSMGGTLAPTAPPGGISGTGIVFAQVAQHTQRGEVDAPPPAPEAPGAYTKKAEDSTGVLAMMDLLIKDLAKEMTESETAEKDSQADYEELMKDSAAKRASDSTTLSEKASAKASLESDLQAQSAAKASGTKELMATLEWISSLHGECDWLLKYYDVRAEARNGEIDALKKAKDVLSGADYSLLQRGVRKSVLARSQ